MRVAVTLEQCWHRVPGGTATSVLALVDALDRLDDLDLVGVAARHAGAPPDEFRPRIPVRHLPLPYVVLYETWHAPLVRFPAVERATGPVDLVHATAIAHPASRAPVVTTIHDLAFLDDPARATRHGHRFFRRGLALARDHSRLVMVPSEVTREACLAQGIDAGRLRLVPWGVDQRRATEEEVTAARARYGLARDYVLFSGTVEPRKNLPRLLRAYARLLDHDVDFVLTGPAGWNEDVDVELRALGSRARPVGFVPRDDLQALLAGARVVTYPSIAEGFGLPVLEAMAQGAPVVTSATTATAEVAGDAAVLIDPLDVDAIAGAIDSVLRDPALAERLREAGQRRAAEYTWDRTARLVRDVYREAVGR